MAIRYYVDEDTISLAKILAPLRHDLTYAGKLLRQDPHDEPAPVSLERICTART